MPFALGSGPRTPAQEKAAAAAARKRKEKAFERAMIKKFGYNASLDPNKVQTSSTTTYYTPPQPEGAVTAPRETVAISIPDQPMASIFRGKIVYHGKQKKKKR